MRHVVRVRVVVERSPREHRRYPRCASGAPPACEAGAISGAIFARHKINGAFRDHARIEVLEISGDLDCTFASVGVAHATVVAAWIAAGVDWSVEDLGDADGWTLRR